MVNRERLLLPVILAALASTAGAADASDAPRGKEADVRQSASYGELLTEMARASAARAGADRGADQTMEAISELAVRWLEMPDGATRVWDECPRSPASVRTAVRNAQRSLWRKERRHERIARAVSTPTAIEANQPAAVELGQFLATAEAGDRDLLLFSAQGMTSSEIARELGISPAAVRQRLRRARQQLG